jgi:hypothetical protein
MFPVCSSETTSHRSQHLPYQTSFFVCLFLWYWGLNSEPHACYFSGLAWNRDLPDLHVLNRLLPDILNPQLSFPQSLSGDQTLGRNPPLEIPCYHLPLQTPLALLATSTTHFPNPILDSTSAFGS